VSLEKYLPLLCVIREIPLVTLCHEVNTFRYAVSLEKYLPLRCVMR